MTKRRCCLCQISGCKALIGRDTLKIAKTEWREVFIVENVFELHLIQGGHYTDCSGRSPEDDSDGI
jgi:hypothetical protein